MTEPLDLDELERETTGVLQRSIHWPYGERVMALIAELRATRAERDAAKWDFLAALADRKDETARAERAEAEVARLVNDYDALSSECCDCCETNKAAIARVEHLTIFDGYVHQDELRAALRGDQ